MSVVLLVPPASEPVSLAEAKAWLRLDTSDEDALVTSLVATARATVEAFTGRAFVSQTWRITLDRWPGPAPQPCFGAALVGTSVTIPVTPVTSVTAVRVYDASGTPQVLSATTYALRGRPDDGHLDFAGTPPAPGRANEGIEIDVVAGYGIPSDVPQPLRQAILMLMARLYENRGDEIDPVPQLRGAATALIAPYRRMRLA